MAVGNWVVSAVLRLNSSGFTAQMSRAAAATKSMNAQLARQNGQMSANELRMMKFQARMSEVRAAQLRFVTGAAAIGAGAGLFGITSAISDAAKLQQILLSIKNETGATGTQIGQFYNTAFAIANKNGMTPVQGAEILRTISRLTAGQFAVEKMMAIAPSVASFASNIHYNRPEIGVDEAAGVGLQTAHLFRAYQPRALNPLLDSVYRLSGLMAEKPEQALRQMSYYVPMFKMLGVANDTSIALMALLDRAGFRNKVGTNVRAQVLESLGPLQTTSHAQQGHLNLLERMGIFRNGRFAWNNANGSINFFGELSQLGKFVSGQIKEGVTRAKIAQEMFGAFGKQGGTIAALFGDPQMTSILAGIQKYLRDPNVGLQAASRNRELGLGFQFTRMIGNFTAVMTELGYPWLQDLTKFFKGIGDNLHNFQAWLHAHRDAEKTIGQVASVLTTLLGGLAIFGTLRLGFTALGIGETAISLLGLGRSVGTFMLGAYVNMSTMIPAALAALRAGIMSFALTMNTGGVMALPGMLARLSLAMLAVPGAAIAFGAAVTGLLVLLQKAAPAGDAMEGKIRPGAGWKTYGTADYWKHYARLHGVNALPSTGLRHRFAYLAGSLPTPSRGHHRTRTREEVSRHDERTHVDVHGGMHFHFDRNASKSEAADAVAQIMGSLALHPRIAIKAAGVYRTGPFLSTGETVGNMTYNR